MTESQLRIDGMKALTDRFGMVEAERFVAILLREKFDYTQWRRSLWGNFSLDKLWEMGQENPTDAL